MSGCPTITASAPHGYEVGDAIVVLTGRRPWWRRLARLPEQPKRYVVTAIVTDTSANIATPLRWWVKRRLAAMRVWWALARVWRWER